MAQALRVCLVLFLLAASNRCGDGVYLAKPVGVAAPASTLYAYVGHSERFAFEGKGLKGARYTVTPGLPAGLSIEADEGAIVGVPTTVTTPTSYSVHLESDFGEADFSFTLKVNPSGATPVMLKDILAAGGSSPVLLGSIDDAVFFRANSAAAGIELWKTDGTASGTSLVKDIESGAGDSTPTALASANNANPFTNRFLFSATTSANGLELWQSDGTSAGTSQVADLESGASSSTFNALAKVSGGFLVSGGEAALGIEPYLANSTGTTLTNLVDIASGADSSPSKLTELGSKVLFFATDGAALGNELYVSDGTSGGTALVKDINAGAGDSPGTGTPIAFNGYVYFSADNGSEGFELWRSDGTTAGTTLVKDIASGATSSDPDGFVTYNNVLYFVADDNVHGAELWRSDGTASGTYLVKDINGTASGSTVTLYPNAVGKYLFFTADDGVNGEELWRTDGTAAGTMLVKNIDGGAGSSTPLQLTMVNGYLFFSATTAAAGRELWKSDGTSSGTAMVSDLFSGSTDSVDSTATFYSWQGMLFYPAAASAGDIELYLATPF